MTEEQKYLFDLQGYIVLKDVVPSSVIAGCNQSLDRLEDMHPQDFPPPLCLGTQKTEKELYISNILESDTAFNFLIDIPEVLSIIDGVTYGSYRLNHTYTIYRWADGYSGLHGHNTPISYKCQYHFRDGEMISTLTKAVFPLIDCRIEDGCFAAIPGSHKSNFNRPWGNHPDENPVFIPILADVGDAIIFTEALTHGSMVNTSGRSRRTLYYCYSVGYMPDWGGQGLAFSDHAMKGLTEAQKEIICLK